MPKRTCKSYKMTRAGRRCASYGGTKRRRSLGQDYSQMTQEDFDRILEELVANMGAGEILAIPGVYEAVSEALNNDVLDIWEIEQEG